MKNAHNRDLIPPNALRVLISPTPTLHGKNTEAMCNHTTNEATLALCLHRKFFPHVW